MGAFDECAHWPLQDWPTGRGLLPSITFRHLAGDPMDKKILDDAEVSNADAIIMGVAHDANPKDVSTPHPNFAMFASGCAQTNPPLLPSVNMHRMSGH